MKKKAKVILILILLLMVFFSVFTREGAFAQLFVTRTLRFTGTICPPDAKDLKGGLAYQRILIENKEWILKVTKVEDTNYPGLTQLQILGQMPSNLIFKEGVKGVLSPFQHPDIVGKVITIQGFVYASSGWMEVNELKIIKKEKKQ
jgi:hypothetical protein